MTIPCSTAQLLLSWNRDINAVVQDTLWGFKVNLFGLLTQSRIPDHGGTGMAGGRSGLLLRAQSARRAQKSELVRR